MTPDDYRVRRPRGGDMWPDHWTRTLWRRIRAALRRLGGGR